MINWNNHHIKTVLIKHHIFDARIDMNIKINFWACLAFAEKDFNSKVFPKTQVNLKYLCSGGTLKFCFYLAFALNDIHPISVTIPVSFCVIMTCLINNFFFHDHHDKGIASLILLRFFISTIFTFHKRRREYNFECRTFIKRFYRYNRKAPFYLFNRLYNGCFIKPAFMKEMWAIS